MRWRCMTKTHRPQTFMSMEEYTAHMTAQHPGKFEGAQLPFLASNAQRPSKKIFKSCPLCGEDDIGNGESLEDHVAHHLQYLALLSLPLPEGLLDTEGAVSTSSTDSHGRQKDDEAALSRTTNKSEWHLMQPATFPEGDEYLWGSARPADDEIPDIDEQKQIEISQKWQLIRAGKVGLDSMDQPITEEERRSDQTLVPFVFRFDLDRKTEASPISFDVDNQAEALPIHFDFDSSTEVPPVLRGLSFRENKQKIPDVHAWLYLLDHSTDQMKAREARRDLDYADQWFLHGQLFTDWKRKPASFLRVTGPPDCGKTLLASAIIDRLEREASGFAGISHALLYFYFGSKHTETTSIPFVPGHSRRRRPPRAPRGRRRDFGDMVRSLVIQLYDSRQHTQHLLHELYSSCQDEKMQPDGALLRGIFEMMIEDAGEIWMVLESLHDCDNGDLDTALALFSWLSIIHSRHENVHVLVTSRPEDGLSSIITEWGLSEE